MPSIQMLITPKAKDIGEFEVRRALPQVKQRSVGPWVFFDHFGPVDFAPGGGINVRPHPHINLATVTYLFEGEIYHRDSLGTSMAILPGAINLMVAGRGITHSERTRDELRKSGYKMHGLQLWMALPEADEEIDPAFYHYPADDIPAVTIGECDVRVMMGNAYGLTSPVKTFSDTLYAEANIPAGKSLTVPSADEVAIYVASGAVEIDGETAPEFSMAVLSSDAKIIRATEDSRIAFIGGAHLGRRYLDWNFVSSRKDRLETAKDDWRNGRFDTVPGDSDEYIPLPK